MFCFKLTNSIKFWNNIIMYCIINIELIIYIFVCRRRFLVFSTILLLLFVQLIRRYKTIQKGRRGGECTHNVKYTRTVLYIYIYIIYILRHRSLGDRRESTTADRTIVQSRINSFIIRVLKFIILLALVFTIIFVILFNLFQVFFFYQYPE